MRSLLPLVLGWILFQSSLGAADPGGAGLIGAIRRGESAARPAVVQAAVTGKERDARGNTPLHWAALAGDQRMVSRLLAAGADPRATNAAGATPLHYGTGNERVVRDLLEAGADPRAKSLNGATPLHSAAARPDGHGSVKRLLAAGADPNQPRALFPGGVNVPMPDPSFGEISPLALAIYYGDPRSAEILLQQGAKPGGTKGVTPLAAAAFSGRGDWVPRLVSRGAELNFDDGFLGHALNNLLYTGHRQWVPFLLEHGVDLHQVTSFGVRTPPMVWSAYTETGDLSVAQALVARGLDVNEPAGDGRTALDWARKRGETPLVAYLRNQGAISGDAGQKGKTPPQNLAPRDARARMDRLREAVQGGLAALQKTSDQFLDNGFVKQSGCVSCHHQTLPAVALGRALERGFTVDEAALARQLHRQVESWSKGLEAAYEMFEPQPDSPANLGYGLFGLGSLNYASDDLTEAMVWFVAQSQLPDGSFPGFDRRPPMEEGQVIGTAMAVGALRRYPQPLRSVDVDRVVGRARAWLKRVSPEDPNQRLFRLLGLGWAGSGPADLRPLVAEILASQRADGGWAGLPGLGSDAWATGMTLFVLQEVGGISPTDPPYRQGADFLLRTQFPDGSWWVPSRTWPLQPHFDSGFPHGKDQWISAGGTAWAVIALLNEIEPVRTAGRPANAKETMARFPGSKAAPTETVGSTRLPGGGQEAGVFAREIRPMLERSCTGCHSGEKPKGGYDLTTREGVIKAGQSGEAAVVPGDPGRSPLLRFVGDQVEDLEMPPLNKRAKYPALSPAEIGRLRAWIAAGAP